MVTVSFLILVSATIIVLQNGRVQTAISKKALKAVTGLIDGEITLDKIHIQPLNTLVIKNVAIKDRSPFVPVPEIAALYGERVPVDTFFRAEYITVRYSLKGLLTGDGFTASSIFIKNAEMNLVLEGGIDNNLTRIFRIDPDKEVEPQTGELFSIQRTEIQNMRFRMLSLGENRVEVTEGGIDWNDLDVSEIYIQASDLTFDDNSMSGDLERMRFREKSGYRCKEIRGTALVGNGQTLVRGLCLDDPWSSLRVNEFSMNYDSVEDFSDFLNLVVLDADLAKSHVSFETIGYFAPEINYAVQEVSLLKGRMHGPISGFSVNDLKFSIADGGVEGDVDVRITGIPDVEQMHFDFNVNEINLDSKGLETFINGWLREDESISLSQIIPGEKVKISGTGNGLLNNLNLDMGLYTRLGNAKARMYVNEVANLETPIVIGGKFQTYGLDLGAILGTDILGKCSLRTGLEARFDSGEKGPDVRIDSLRINSLDFNDYIYNNIYANGKLEGNLFDGGIVCNDPNLNFMIQGAFALSPKTQNAVYKFYANVGLIDLHALNFDMRGTSKASFWASANINNINRKDIVGNIDVKDVILVNSEGKYDIGDISVSGHTNNDIFRANVSADFADLHFTSTGSIKDFIDDIINTTAKRELPDLFENPELPQKYHNHDLLVKFHDTRNLLAFAAPGLYVADDTRLGVHINSDGLLNTRLTSQRIALETTFIRDVEGIITNEDQMLSAELDFSCFSGGNFLLENNSIFLNAANNNFGARVSYDNLNGETVGEILASGSIERQEDESVSANLNISPSMASLNGSRWEIEESEAFFSKGSIKIPHFGLRNYDQYITVSGGISSGEIKDTLNLDFNRFRISTIDELLTTDIGLKGIVSGDAELSTSEGTYGIEMNMESDSTFIGNTEAGRIYAECKWDNLLNKFNIKAHNQIDSICTVNALASLTPSSKRLDAEVELNGFDLGYLQPIVKDIFSEFRGSVYGKISATGPLDRLDLQSEGTRVENGRLNIGFTNVPYTVNGPVRISETGLYFDNISIKDGLGGTGNVNGSLYWDHFQDMGLDVHAKASNLLCVNTTQELNEFFYGNLTGSGKIAVTGPMEQITLTVDAATTRRGELHIPLSSSSIASTTNLLKYTEAVSTEEVDPYEQMLDNLNKSKNMTSDLIVKVRATATPDVDAFIEIDKASGNVIQARGNGTVDMDITTDTFNLRGDYTITSGNYKFVALGLATRDFLIQDGSTIRFNGDIMDTNLDIDAIYKTKASLSTLIADTTSVNTRKVVECGISISDKLLNPRVGFSINIPNVDPTVKSKVENALSSEDKIQKQFLSLILSNSFLPDEQSGIVNNSSILYSNVTEMMANQLNNILTKLEIPLDLGLNYQPNERGNDIFDVAVSTQLFNNRVVVNGNLGNRQYSSSSNSDIVGDLDIEIKIDRPGNLRLTLFSHSADQYSNYLDNSQRNGVGVTFQQEFNSFLPWVKGIFTNKKKKEEEQIRNANIEVPQKVIRINENDDNRNKKR